MLKFLAVSEKIKNSKLFYGITFFTAPSMLNGLDM